MADAFDMKKITVSVIGCGAMGGAVLRALCKKIDPQSVKVSAKRFEHAEAIAAETKCVAVKTNSEAARKSDYVFIAVKPAYVLSVLEEISGELKDDATVVSMAAGVPLEALSKASGKPAVRIMPNMPVSVGEGMIALAASGDVSEERVAAVCALLEASGKVERVDEKLMDCVTAVSGSGPAYAFVFIEALADAAVRSGMPRDEAYVYAAQTVKGAAAAVLACGKNPASLKDAVCSPGGTTIEGVAALEKGGFRSAVFDAVKAAYEKSAAMSKM
ncbi:pyrroline-5-carboxylate reductase [Treponema socranskii subsp. paredis ATCC 35535]|nr:pyrroline-5-carboxylate reductase [Treponema socranskii subsp. paredis ATCC 35535]